MEEALNTMRIHADILGILGSLSLINSATLWSITVTAAYTNDHITYSVIHNIANKLKMTKQKINQ